MDTLNTGNFGKKPIVITDVGSTTTKAILFQKNGTWKFTREEGPTTVEKPLENVTIGATDAIRELEKTTGLKLLKNGKPCVPYFSTSSAGGGLAMVVAGLIRQITAKSAERVALGAGAILLDIIALDDNRTPYKKIEALNKVRPDMVLLSGGFDHGSLSGPVFIAEIISQAELHPKLSKQGKLDLIFAGNTDANEWVRETLSPKFIFHNVPNIRPEGDRENLEPARDKIHELFIQHVMSHAPGYEELKTWVNAPILPTPAAFSELLKLVSQDIDKRILAIDIGGATTDIFTADGGDVFRTVSANLGMSYSILNVVKEAGVKSVEKLLNMPSNERELLDHIGNKYLNPVNLPMSATEADIEQAVATLAIREAVKEHLSVLKGLSFSLGEEELSLGRLKPQEIKWNDSNEFMLEGYDIIIGSGGVLSHSPREITTEILLNALQPREIVTLAVDNVFMFPHLGVLSQVAPDLARELFYQLGYVKMATVISPKTEEKRDKIILTIKKIDDKKQESEISIKTGEVKVLPDSEIKASGVTITGGNLDVKHQKIKPEDCELGLIMDGRGRPLESPARIFTNVAYKLHDRKIKATPEKQIYEGEIRLTRELAIPGEVYVHPGDEVGSDTMVAKSVKAFLRPFFLEIASAINVEPEKFREVFHKNIGDQIKSGENLAATSGIFGKKFRSPVSGMIEKILPDGSIVIREQPEYAKEVYIVDVGRDLSVKPYEIKPYLKVEVGQEVDREQHVAAKMTVNEMKFVRSPMRGVIADIKLEEGLVVIEPLLEELELLAWLPGKVEKVTDKGCTIANTGIVIHGAWGIGEEVSGKLVFDTPERDCVMVSETVSGDLFNSLEKSNAAGLITAGLHLAHLWDKEPEFTIVSLYGFGEQKFTPEIMDILKQHEGKLVLLDGTTQLRVGVKRPKVIFPR